jgi:hypothetical protein
VVRLVVDDAESARRALREAGLAAEEMQVLSAFLPHAPGELATVTRKLADSGINIDAVYVINSSAEGIELAIAVDQPETALPHLPVRGGVG